MRNIILSLKKYLLANGFDKEYAILKSAYPIIDDGFMSMKEDESVVVRDKESRRDRVNRYRVSDWYDSVDFVRDDIIVISFSGVIGEEFFKKICELAGKKKYFNSSYTYSDITNLTFNASIDNSDFLSAFPSAYEGVRSALLKKYPDLSEEALREKAEGEIVIILLGENPVGAFNKSPYYLGHDLGHQLMDEGDNFGFKYDLVDLLNSVAEHYELYRDDEADDLSAATLLSSIEEGGGMGFDEPIFILLSEFFPTKNANDIDRHPDIFANFLEGNFSFYSPRTIRHGNNYYETSEEGDKKVKAILQDFVDRHAINFGGSESAGEDVLSRLGDKIEDMGSPLEEIHGKTIFL